MVLGAKEYLEHQQEKKENTEILVIGVRGRTYMAMGVCLTLPVMLEKLLPFLTKDPFVLNNFWWIFMVAGFSALITGIIDGFHTALIRYRQLKRLGKK